MQFLLQDVTEKVTLRRLENAPKNDCKRLDSSLKGVKRARKNADLLHFASNRQLPNEIEYGKLKTQKRQQDWKQKRIEVVSSRKSAFF